MYQRLKTIARRRLIILDLCSLALSYLLALITRYSLPLRVVRWQAQSYMTVLLLAALIYSILYLFYDSRKPPIMDQDQVDVVLTVLKNAALLFILLMGYLYCIKELSKFSRIVFGSWFLYFLLVDCLARQWYRGRKVRFLRSIALPERNLLITAAAYAPFVQNRFSQDPYGLQITDTLLLDKETPDRWSTAISLTSDKTEDLGLKAKPCQSYISQSTSGQAGAVRMAEKQGDEALRKQSRSSKPYDKALIYLPDTDISSYLNGNAGQSLNDVIDGLSAAGTRVYKIQFLGTDPAGAEMVHSFGGFQSHRVPSMAETGSVLGVRFQVSNPESAVLYVRRNLQKLYGHYICFCNVHTTVMSRERADYCSIQNNAALTFPDGAPIAHELRSLGLTEAKRVAGPDFMDAMFSSTMDGRVTHYFYGASPETIAKLEENLRQRYPGIVIRGLYSPPFRPLTAEEDAADIDRINASGADLIWIGLGAPKQEQWMAAHEGRIHGVMLGVGAGFDFFAGTIQRAPKWMQKIGLEWLYRLFKDPKRLFRRYFVTNTKYMWYLLMDRVIRK